MTPHEITEGNKQIAEFFELGYSIDLSGRVIGKIGKSLKLHQSGNGYYQVNTWSNGKQKSFLLHRLLASAFIPNPNNLPEVNHKNGIKTDNHVENLEWCSRSYNIKHGIETGLIKKSMIGRTGKKHWRSKTVIQLNGNTVIAEFESTGEAARNTGFDRISIQDACTGKLKTYRNFIWKYKV